MFYFDVPDGWRVQALPEIPGLPEGWQLRTGQHPGKHHPNWACTLTTPDHATMTSPFIYPSARIAQERGVAIARKAVRQEETVRCEAVIHTGPGHQSRRHCTRTDLHPADGDHWVAEVVYEWTGAEAYSRELS